MSVKLVSNHFGQSSSIHVHCRITLIQLGNITNVPPVVNHFGQSSALAFILSINFNTAEKPFHVPPVVNHFAESSTITIHWRIPNSGYYHILMWTIG